MNWLGTASKIAFQKRNVPYNHIFVLVERGVVDDVDLMEGQTSAEGFLTGE